MNTDNKLHYTVDFELLKNDDKVMEIAEINHFQEEMCIEMQHILIEKQKFLEDFFYKNLETSVLQAIKLKVENELLQRKLREKIHQTDDAK